MFFFSSRRRHTRFDCDWSSDVCSSDLEAVEAANITSYQMRNSFGDHESQPGRLTLRSDTPPWVRRDLREMGYRLEFQERTSGPINAIFFDWKHGSFWGGASDHGGDYGIAW